MDSALKFELEIKKRPAQHLGLLLLNGSYQEFEDYFSKSFFKHFWKSIFLETCFTDWLVDSCRIRHPIPKNHLVSSSLKKNFLSRSNAEMIEFYRLLQFLSFVKSCSGKKEILNRQTYITVKFPLIDFIRATEKSINSYQRKQYKNFFNKLQDLPPYREQFAEHKFRQLLFFPVVNSLQNGPRQPWIIEIAVAEQLMLDNYPFHFPPSFFTYSNTINLEIKLSIIQAIAQGYSLEKIYSIESFLNRYKKRRNSLQAEVKKEILNEFQNLLKYKIIEDRFIFQSKDGQQIFSKDNIQLEDIKSSKYFYFYEIIYPIK